MPTKQGILVRLRPRHRESPSGRSRRSPSRRAKCPASGIRRRSRFPRSPPAYAKNGTSIDDLIDFTPELRAQAVTIASRYKLGPIFTPPVVSKAEGRSRTLARGPTNGGIELARRSIRSRDSYGLRRVVERGAGGARPRSAEQGSLRHELGRGHRAAPAGGGRGGGGLSVQGLSIFKPPYGTISAINLDKGDIAWQVPHGETPDAVRNHEALKGMNIPRTGQPGFIVGTLVTKTLVIAGDAQVTTLPTRPRGAMLRAYDKATGAEVGAVLLPAPVERIADDVLGGRQAVHRRRGERRSVLRRVHRAATARRADRNEIAPPSRRDADVARSRSLCSSAALAR